MGRKIKMIVRVHIHCLHCSGNWQGQGAVDFNIINQQKIKYLIKTFSMLSFTHFELDISARGKWWDTTVVLHSKFQRL